MRFARAGNGNKAKFRLSVREFVEFAKKEGGLDDRVSVRSAQEAMLLGAKLHRKIQKSSGGDYQSEVPFSLSLSEPAFDLTVEGRADGVIFTEENGEKRALIDEIKGIYLPLEDLTAPLEVHRAQAICYAYMLSIKEKLSSVDVQITYIHMESEEIRRFRETLSSEDLKDYFEEVLEAHLPFFNYYTQWVSGRDASMETLTFPFNYREGQKALVAGVYRTIREHAKLYLMAPTGVGKTMAVLYPGIRAVGEGLAERIFYLTARTVGAAAPSHAYEILREHGLQFRTVTVTAKEKICFMNSPSCNPEDCPYAEGYFEKIRAALLDLLLSPEPFFTKDEIRKAAAEHIVCPYELTLDLSVWMDGLICDYNYVFDPDAKLKRFFADGGGAGNLFFIDEAHHMVERTRDMYSAVLVKEDVLAARKILKERDPKAYRALGGINTKMLALKKEMNAEGRFPYQILSDDKGLSMAVLRGLSELDRLFEESRDVRLKEELLEFYFKLRSYENASERADENYVLYEYPGEDGHFSVRQFCIDPSDHVRECLSDAAGAVFFSATFLPIRYYRELLGAEEQDSAVYAPSPFDPVRRGVFLASDISARYKERGEDAYRRIAAYIAACVKQKKGNYIVYFPSYKMMEDVFAIYRDEFDGPEVSWVVQSRYMGEEEREIFLENFEYASCGTMIGFCVMGGLFSEGIDLTGDRLIGTIIVGTGLPQLSAEGEVLKDAYDRRGMNGFDYAYRFPGMNKVLQAGGRVIRTPEDEGLILLLDDRFLSGSYRGLFPREWENRQVCTIETVGELVGAFWNRQNKQFE